MTKEVSHRWWIGGVAALWLAAGCHPSGPAKPATPRRTRPTTADLMTLVPEGAHILVRLDLTRMRRFWAQRPWSKHFKGSDVGRRLHADLGSDLLRHAEVLVIALWLDAAAGVGRILMLARGPRTEGIGLASRARRVLAGRTPGRPGTSAPPRRPPGRKSIRWQTYRDTAISDGQGVSTALLSPFVVASGPSTTVRQSVDLLRGLPGRSSAREDRELAALWRLVAGESAGRSPLLAAVARLPAELRARAAKRLRLPGPVHRVGLRLSGARWVTLRAFVDVAGRRRGRATVKALHSWVQRLVATAVGQRLRLARLLSPLAVHHEGGRVHMQWVLPTRLLDRHARILAPVLKILGAAPRPGGKPPPPRKRK